MKSEEYYRVVGETPPEGFTVEERYKVVSETPSEGFTAEECNKITEGPEKADSLEDLDKAPEVEGTQEHEKVKDAVNNYFSKSFLDSAFEPKPEQNIDIGGENGTADLVLYAPEKEKYVAIAEAKRGKDDANYGRRQLFSYLCAKNTRFGVFANSLDCNAWVFYENLRHFRFRKIESFDFEKEIAEGNYNMPDKPLELKDIKRDFGSVIEEMLKSQRDDVQSAVKAYFSPIRQQDWKCELKEKYCNIQIGSKSESKVADFVLQGRDGSYIAIVEVRDNNAAPNSVLDMLLCATDARFGIRVSGPNPRKWKFYERSGSHRPNEIEDPSEFTAKVVAQTKEAACPVFKGEVLLKKKWDEYSKTWNTLKSEKVWRVAKTYHPKCPFKIDEYISCDEYKRAQEAYPGCSVEKGDILTKAELDEQHKTWPRLTTEKVWRVTGVFHSDCSFTVGQYISKDDYEQALVDYPRCPVRQGDILTKVEFTEHRKTWKNLKAEKVPKIKLWQFVTVGIGLFLVCFGLLFLVQRDGTEDAAHQNAVLVNQLTQKESEIRQKDQEIQGLTTSVQTLKGENEILSQKISKLENQEKNIPFPIDKSVMSLQKQLNEQENENQKMRGQLIGKDTEIQQLQKDKKAVLSENRRLRSQLVEEEPKTINQNTTVQQLKSDNQKLQSQNSDLVRQNQELQNQNKAFQNQLNHAKQGNSNQVEKVSSPPSTDKQRTDPPQTENLVAEPPEKIRDYKEVITRAGSHNNQGCLDFDRNDYDEAVKQFEQAIKADSQFAVAHYNLGCTYLKMKKYSHAINAFNEAVNLDHGFQEAYYNRSLAYFRVDRFQEAKRDADKVLSIVPEYRIAQELLTAIENAQR